MLRQVRNKCQPVLYCMFHKRCLEESVGFLIYVVVSVVLWRYSLFGAHSNELANSLNWILMHFLRLFIQLEYLDGSLLSSVSIYRYAFPLKFKKKHLADFRFLPQFLHFWLLQFPWFFSIINLNITISFAQLANSDEASGSSRYEMIGLSVKSFTR